MSGRLLDFGSIPVYPILIRSFSHTYDMTCGGSKTKLGRQKLAVEPLFTIV
jgi:hypothetical protein